MSKAAAIYREATPAERVLADALRKCNFPPASFSKRFARDLQSQIQARGQITDKQSERLIIQAYIYRRQILLPPGTEAAQLIAAPPAGYSTPKQRQASALAAVHRQFVKTERLRNPSAAAPPPARDPVADPLRMGQLL